MPRVKTLVREGTRGKDGITDQDFVAGHGSSGNGNIHKRKLRRPQTQIHYTREITGDDDDSLKSPAKRCCRSHRLPESLSDKDCVMRTTHLPESEAGQDGALVATACQRHSPNIGSQAPVSLTKPLSLKDREKKRERDHLAWLSQLSICVKNLEERTQRREKAFNNCCINIHML
ncbi:hypothetical protein Bca101_035621 [Brassica carinata]